MGDACILNMADGLEDTMSNSSDDHFQNETSVLSVCKKITGLAVVSLSVLLLCAVMSNTFHLSPSFKIKNFYIPALDKSLSSSKDASIAFDISFTTKAGSSSNVNYDPINVTFYDSPRQNHSIAKFIIPEFYQGEDSTVDYSGMVNATGFDLDHAKQEISANGFKVFRVGLETSVRYDFYWFRKTRRYDYKKGVDVKVGDTGAAVKFGNNFVEIKVLVMFNLMVVVFLCSY